MTTRSPRIEFDTSLDTSVVRLLINRGVDDPDYEPLLEGAHLAVTYFTDAELAVRPLIGQERDRYDRLRTRLHQLSNPGPRTKEQFVKAAQLRHGLGLSRRQRDLTDLWIVAQTAEYGLRLASHDREMLRVADALRIETVTLLPGIEQQLNQDRLRLARG